MLAVVHLAPLPSGIQTRLQLLADFMVEANAAWIREQLAQGLRPPVRVLDARPPWTRVGGVRYVRHHGDAEVDQRRDYLDAPSMFARGDGTCFDIGAYDAAAALTLEHRNGSGVVVLPSSSGPGRYHLWLRIGPRGRLVNPVAGFAQPDARNER